MPDGSIEIFLCPLVPWASHGQIYPMAKLPSLPYRYSLG